MINDQRDNTVWQKIQKAKARLLEIPDYINLGYFHRAINRMYYSSFYAGQALLLSVNIALKSHKGTVNMFSLHFVKKGKIPESLSDFYATIFYQRGLADYTDIEDYDKEMCESLYVHAKEFILFIDKLVNKNS